MKNKKVLLIFIAILLLCSGCSTKNNNNKIDDKNNKDKVPNYTIDNYIGNYDGSVYYLDENGNSYEYYGHTDYLTLHLSKDYKCSIFKDSMELITGVSYEPRECTYKIENNGNITLILDNDKKLLLEYNEKEKSLMLKQNLLYDNDYVWDFEYYNISGIKYVIRPYDAETGFKYAFDPPYEINKDLTSQISGMKNQPYHITIGTASNINDIIKPNSGIYLKFDGECDFNKLGRYPIKIIATDINDNVVYYAKIIIAIVPKTDDQIKWYEEHVLDSFGVSLISAKNSDTYLNFHDKTFKKQVCLNPYSDTYLNILILKDLGCEEYYEIARDFYFLDYSFANGVTYGKYATFEETIATSKTYGEMYEFVQNYDKPLKYKSN